MPAKTVEVPLPEACMETRISAQPKSAVPIVRLPSSAAETTHGLAAVRTETGIAFEKRPGLLVSIPEQPGLVFDVRNPEFGKPGLVYAEQVSGAAHREVFLGNAKSVFGLFE